MMRRRRAVGGASFVKTFSFWGCLLLIQSSALTAEVRGQQTAVNNTGRNEQRVEFPKFTVEVNGQQGSYQCTSIVALSVKRAFENCFLTATNEVCADNLSGDATPTSVLIGDAECESSNGEIFLGGGYFDLSVLEENASEQQDNEISQRDVNRCIRKLIVSDSCLTQVQIYLSTASGVSLNAQGSPTPSPTIATPQPTPAPPTRSPTKGPTKQPTKAPTPAPEEEEQQQPIEQTEEEEEEGDIVDHDTGGDAPEEEQPPAIDQPEEEEEEKDAGDNVGEDGDGGGDGSEGGAPEEEQPPAIEQPEGGEEGKDVGDDAGEVGGGVDGSEGDASEEEQQQPIDQPEEEEEEEDIGDDIGEDGGGGGDGSEGDAPEEEQPPAIEQPEEEEEEEAGVEGEDNGGEGAEEGAGDDGEGDGVDDSDEDENPQSQPGPGKKPAKGKGAEPKKDEPDEKEDDNKDLSQAEPKKEEPEQEVADEDEELSHRDPPTGAADDTSVVGIADTGSEGNESNDNNNTRWNGSLLAIIACAAVGGALVLFAIFAVETRRRNKRCRDDGLKASDEALKATDELQQGSNCVEICSSESLNGGEGMEVVDTEMQKEARHLEEIQIPQQESPLPPSCLGGAASSSADNCSTDGGNISCSPSTVSDAGSSRLGRMLSSSAAIVAGAVSRSGSRTTATAGNNSNVTQPESLEDYDNRTTSDGDSLILLTTVPIGMTESGIESTSLSPAPETPRYFERTSSLRQPDLSNTDPPIFTRNLVTPSPDTSTRTEGAVVHSASVSASQSATVQPPPPKRYNPIASAISSFYKNRSFVRSESETDGGGGGDGGNASDMGVCDDDTDDAGGAESSQQSSLDFEVDPSWDPDDNSVGSDELNDPEEAFLRRSRSKNSSYRMEPLEIPPEIEDGQKRISTNSTPRAFITPSVTL